MSKIKEKLVAYYDLVRLFRLRNFVPSVLIIIFLGIQQQTPLNLIIINSIQVLVILGWLLYGGIYALNEIADIEEDRAIKYKSLRPLVTGKLTVKNAIFISITHLFVTAICLYFVNNYLLTIFALLLLTVNILYTFVFKKISRIFSSLIVPSTFILRVLYPILLLGVWRSEYIWIILGLYISGASLHLNLQRRIGYIKGLALYYVIKYTSVLSILIGICASIYFKNPIYILPQLVAYLGLYILDKETLISVFKYREDYTKLLKDNYKYRP